MKTESKHTPGPGPFFPVRLNGKVFVATRPFWAKRDDPGSLQVAEIIPWKVKECTDRHVALLCAAPELLEACKSALRTLLPLYAHESLVIKSLKDAIAKAEGSL